MKSRPEPYSDGHDDDTYLVVPEIQVGLRGEFKEGEKVKVTIESLKNK